MRTIGLLIVFLLLPVQSLASHGAGWIKPSLTPLDNSTGSTLELGQGAIQFTQQTYDYLAGQGPIRFTPVFCGTALANDTRSTVSWCVFLCRPKGKESYPVFCFDVGFSQEAALKLLHQDQSHKNWRILICQQERNRLVTIIFTDSSLFNVGSLYIVPTEAGRMNTRYLLQSVGDLATELGKSGKLKQVVITNYFYSGK